MIYCKTVKRCWFESPTRLKLIQIGAKTIDRWSSFNSCDCNPFSRVTSQRPRNSLVFASSLSRKSQNVKNDYSPCSATERRTEHGSSMACDRTIVVMLIFLCSSCAWYPRAEAVDGEDGCTAGGCATYQILWSRV